MARRGSVYSDEGLCVWNATTQTAALEEACRRLTVMYQKWPDTRWRMAVRKDRLNGQRWGVYALVDPGFPS